MSVVCLNWKTVHLHGEAWISHHRLRHRLFVERQGWQVPSYEGLEHDEFDTPAAQYLLWLDDAGKTRGVARLLPTTQPYMIQKLWPDLIEEQPPVCSGVWEATRFCCDPSLDAATRRRIVAEIICATQEFGLARGIRRYLTVMPQRLLKYVLQRAGCEVEILGPERTLGNLPAVAASLAIRPDILAEIRKRGGLTGPALQSDLSVAA